MWCTSLARSTMAFRLSVETLWAISPAYERLCIMRSSRSLMFETTNFLKPASCVPSTSVLSTSAALHSKGIKDRGDEGQSATESTANTELTTRQQVPVLLVCAIANVWHVDATSFKLPPHARVNTLRSPP